MHQPLPLALRECRVAEPKAAARQPIALRIPVLDFGGCSDTTESKLWALNNACTMLANLRPGSIHSLPFGAFLVSTNCKMTTSWPVQIRLEAQAPGLNEGRKLSSNYSTLHISRKDEYVQPGMVSITYFADTCTHPCSCPLLARASLKHGYSVQFC